MNEQDSRTIKRLADIKAALTARAMTVTELAAAIHINRASAGKYISDLHGDRIFIESWQRAASHITAAYRWGDGKDAPKPPAHTPEFCERERMERIKKNPELRDRYLSYHRARGAAKRAARQKNPWFGALPGARAASMNAEG